jgi:hypothetical protein
MNLQLSVRFGRVGGRGVIDVWCPGAGREGAQRVPVGRNRNGSQAREGAATTRRRQWTYFRVRLRARGESAKRCKRLCEECCAKDYDAVQGSKQNARLSSSKRPIVSSLLVRASQCPTLTLTGNRLRVHLASFNPDFS